MIVNRSLACIHTPAKKRGFGKLWPCVLFSSPPPFTIRSSSGRTIGGGRRVRQGRILSRLHTLIQEGENGKYNTWLTPVCVGTQPCRTSNWERGKEDWGKRNLCCNHFGGSARLFLGPKCRNTVQQEIPILTLPNTTFWRLVPATTFFFWPKLSKNFYSAACTLAKFPTDPQRRIRKN